MIDEWLNHTARAKAACAAGLPEPRPWARVSCRAVATMPPPSPPQSSGAGRALAARARVGKAGGGKGGGGGESKQAADAPDTLCRARHESVMPFEKGGAFYPQSAGYCASRYAIVDESAACAPAS